MSAPLPDLDKPSPAQSTERWCGSRAAAPWGSRSWGRVEKKLDGKQIPEYFFKYNMKYGESADKGIDLDLIIPA